MTGKEIEFRVLDSKGGHEAHDDPSPVEVMIEYRSYCLGELSRNEPSVRSGFKQNQTWVEPGFADQVFETIPARKEDSGQDGIKKLEVVELFLDDGDHGDGLNEQMILAELDRRGFKPAVYEELLAYQRNDKRMTVSPDGGCAMLALGSFTMRDGKKYFPGRGMPSRTGIRSLVLFSDDEIFLLVYCLVIRK